MHLEPTVAALRHAIPDLVAVYSFGSQARGDARPDSDVDLAILGPRPLDPLERWDLQERLAGRLGVDVDLVDLRAASAVMRVRVIADGVLLFDGAPSVREAFEAYALGAYARLQDERRGILEDIRRTGHVYG